MNRDILLQIEGSLLERLIQRALQEGAEFAGLRRTGPRSIQIEANPASAGILSALCKRYGYNCRILRRSGLSALLDLLRRRWTLLPAVLACTLLCGLFLGRIWLVDVEFTGPTAHLGSRDEITAILRENGIQAGMARTSIDTALMQKQIAARAGNYSYIGMKQEGIRLLVEASPETPAPGLYAIGHARDLVALRSGIIDEITVYSGQAAVSVGDTVLPGDLLIRGEEPVGKNTETGESITTPVRALGRVTARCWFEGYASAPMQAAVQQRTGRTAVSSRIRLLDFTLPLLEAEGYSSEETETEALPIVGLFLPLELQRSIHHETRQEIIKIDPAELERRLTLLARADALNQIEARTGQYEIVSSWTDANQNGNTLHLRAVYEICTDIAAERDALIEEVY